jgi:4-diphosphocytidyl-2-C-methyl-D-erythritol kinase
MIHFPNAKINLGLHVIRKREDGYHDIETVFYPLPFFDIVEVLQNTHGEEVILQTNGLALPPSSKENLCVLACKLIKKDHPSLPPLKIILHKVIPPGAGLGGGSSDAAFTLALLNKKFQLGISNEKMADYALQLGSDCPFFLVNEACFATGRGEILEKIPLELHEYLVVLINPGIHVDTTWAYAQLRPHPHETPLRTVIQQPVNTWKTTLVNDFEEMVFARYPAISETRKTLYEAGAVYSSMSGSGSTVYGLFRKNEMPALKFPRNYFQKILSC